MTDHARNTRWGWALVLMAGCRFGGPSGAGSEAPVFDAAATSDVAVAMADAAAPDARPDHAADEAEPVNATDAGCAAPFASAICDPVCNTGCASLSRCDVSDKPQTGACVGIWISAENETCVIKSSTTDQCAVQLTCLAGVCRRLCYRDDDCKLAHTCCSESVDVGGAPSGFKVCAPCAP